MTLHLIFDTDVKKTDSGFSRFCLWNNRILHKTQGCHSAFLKQFSRYKKIWSFGLFLAFFNLEENRIILGLFWLNFNKTYHILWYFKIYLIHFGNFSLKIWPLFCLFYHLRILTFFEVANGQIWPFYFLRPGAHHIRMIHNNDEIFFNFWFQKKFWK